MICASAFYHLHNISQICKFLSTDTTKALVHANVTSHVDYCNSLLYGLPASHLNKVRRILNAAVRLVSWAPRYGRIMPLLYELYWLPVRQHISFKILLFVFKAIHGFVPTYLRELVSIKRLGNYNLRSSSNGCLQRKLIEVGLHWETDHSRSQLPHSGMYYHVRFILLQI